MFASRIASGSATNAWTVRLAQLRSEKRALLDLTVSNPTRVGLSMPGDAVLRALSDPRVLVYEPAALGMRDAREAVARYYARAHNANVPADRVVLTASTSEAYALLFKLLCAPGDAVLVPSPSYPLFEHLAALECVETLAWPLVYAEGWHADLDALEARVTPKCRAVVVVSPNNPTGSCVSTRELARLMAICARHDMALIVDEVFLDHVVSERDDRAPSAACVSEADALVFVLSGLSKVAALPQVKLGWIVVRGPDALCAGALARLEIACDTYLSVSSMAQWAAPAWLETAGEVTARVNERVRANRATARALCAGSPCSVLESDGGWSLVLRVPAVKSDEAWALEWLERDGVVVHPGYFFDLESTRAAYAVVSTITACDAFEDGLARIIARVKQGAR